MQLDLKNRKSKVSHEDNNNSLTRILVLSMELDLKKEKGKVLMLE
jgi:hypothetical protein